MALPTSDPQDIQDAVEVINHAKRNPAAAILKSDPNMIAIRLLILRGRSAAISMVSEFA